MRLKDQRFRVQSIGSVYSDFYGATRMMYGATRMMYVEASWDFTGEAPKVGETLDLVAFDEAEYESVVVAAIMEITYNREPVPSVFSSYIRPGRESASLRLAVDLNRAEIRHKRRWADWEVGRVTG